MGVVPRDMTQEHTYTTTIAWTGNKGTGTVAYDAYARDYEIACDGKATIRGSADPKYLGDAKRHNPEDMLVAALSSCHMLGTCIFAQPMTSLLRRMKTLQKG